jgi:hypothetical protein
LYFQAGIFANFWTISKWFWNRGDGHVKFLAICLSVTFLS